MKAKISSFFVLQLALLVGVQTFSSSSFAQDATVTDPAAATQDASVAPDGSAPVDGALPTDPAAPIDGALPADPVDPAAAEAPIDDASNAASAAESATAETAHGFGLKELWAQGDPVARGTLIIMVIMSAATWYVLVTKLIQQQVLLNQAKLTRKFWDSKDLNDGLNTYKANSAFRSVAEDGILAAKQHVSRQGEKIDFPEWMSVQLQRSVERVTSQWQTGLSVLATIGSTSPFVGLFGTVWGIYNALIAIGLSGQASIDKVAGPVGEALIMTAIGLGVAVPAVLGYNWLVRRNKVIVDNLRSFAADIHAQLTMGVRGGQND